MVYFIKADATFYDTDISWVVGYSDSKEKADEYCAKLAKLANIIIYTGTEFAIKFSVRKSNPETVELVPSIRELISMDRNLVSNMPDCQFEDFEHVRDLEYTVKEMREL